MLCEVTGPAERREVHLDPGLQARILEQMREEQAAALRRRAALNWVLLPLTTLAFVIGAVLSFSSDLGVAMFANLVATSIAYVLYRVNKERIRDWFGR